MFVTHSKLLIVIQCNCTPVIVTVEAKCIQPT